MIVVAGEAFFVEEIGVQDVDDRGRSSRTLQAARRDQPLLGAPAHGVELFQIRPRIHPGILQPCDQQSWRRQVGLAIGRELREVSNEGVFHRGRPVAIIAQVPQICWSLGNVMSSSEPTTRSASRSSSAR